MAAVGHLWRHEPTSTPTAVTDPGPMRVIPASLTLVGIVALLISAWAGIAPYVGPIFGYSADGSGSWTWSTSHTYLGLIPGAVGCAAAVVLLMMAPRSVYGRGRPAIGLSGLCILLVGAWFVMGPISWLVLRSDQYFVGASPLDELAHQIGYAFGPGVILAACGGFVLGWVGRHQRVGVAAVEPMAPPVQRVAEMSTIRPIEETSAPVMNRPIEETSAPAVNQPIEETSAPSP